MKVLTPTEKKRYQQSSKSFFEGCEEFVTKCVDERRKVYKDVEKIVNEKTIKIKKQQENVEKKNNSNAMLFVIGGIAVSLSVILYNLGKVDTEIKNKYLSTARDYQNAQTEMSLNDPNVKKTEKVYEDASESLGEKIGEALSGFFSASSDKFIIPEMKANGFAEPMLKIVFETGLYWSMMASGLEWLADLFNIRNSSLTQIQYGIFAELSSDKNAYFGNVSGERGFEGARKTVEGYNYIRQISDQRALLRNFVVQGIWGQVKDPTIHEEKWDEYVAAMNQIQAVLDAGANSGRYTMDTIEAYKNAKTYDIIRHLASYSDRATTDFQYPLHYIMWRGQGVTLNYGDNYKFPWFEDGHQLQFVNKIVEYVERYISTLAKTSSQEKFLEGSWRGYKSGWRGDYNAHGHHFFFYNPDTHQREVRWIAINFFTFLSFVPLVAEHEVHTSRGSIEHISGLYEEFLVESEARKTTNQLADFIRQQQQFKDEYADLYISGLISLNTYLKRVRSDVLIMIKELSSLHYDNSIFYKGFVEDNGGDNIYHRGTMTIYYTNMLNFDTIANEINFENKYISKLKKIMKKIQIIRSMIGFDMSAERIDELMNESDDLDDDLFDDGEKRYMNNEQEMNSQLILIDNWSSEPDFRDGNQTTGETLETLKDYMGDDISNISNFSSERLLNTIFDVADVLDMSIEDERRRRVELIDYIKTAFDSFFREPQQNET